MSTASNCYLLIAINSKSYPSLKKSMAVLIMALSQQLAHSLMKLNDLCLFNFLSCLLILLTGLYSTLFHSLCLYLLTFTPYGKLSSSLSLFIKNQLYFSTLIQPISTLKTCTLNLLTCFSTLNHTKMKNGCSCFFYLPRRKMSHSAIQDFRFFINFTA